MLLIKLQELFLITVLPILHITGFICNIFCIKIFSTQNKFKNNIYRYLIANSIIDAFFLLFFSIVPFTQCFMICENWLNVYLLKSYKKYAAAYFCRVLDMISSLINISIVIERYLCLKGIKINHEKLIFVCTFVSYTLFSMLLFIPNIFFIQIKVKNDTSTLSNKTIGYNGFQSADMSSF